LVDEKGNQVVVSGKWLNHQCTYGFAQPFLVQASVYTDVNNKCKAKGFEMAMPADHDWSLYYPFQVENALTEYIRPTFSGTYDLTPQVALDKC